MFVFLVDALEVPHNDMLGQKWSSESRGSTLSDPGAAKGQHTNSRKS